MGTKKKSEASRATKRARFAEAQEKRPTSASPLVLIAGLVVVLALIGGTAFALTRPAPDTAESPVSASLTQLDQYPTGSQGLLVKAATHGHDPYPAVFPKDNQVRFALSTFDDYQAHHYTYMHEGQPIEFFILKSHDGVVRAAFNACDVCFDSKKGYTQDGDHMICNNCGRRFPADQINVVHGGCNPSGLERTVEGDTLIIQVEDLISGQDYF